MDTVYYSLRRRQAKHAAYMVEAVLNDGTRELICCTEYLKGARRLLRELASIAPTKEELPQRIPRISRTEAALKRLDEERRMLLAQIDVIRVQEERVRRGYKGVRL